MHASDYNMAPLQGAHSLVAKNDSNPQNRNFRQDFFFLLILWVLYIYGGYSESHHRRRWFELSLKKNEFRQQREKTIYSEEQMQGKIRHCHE